ncbi:hypothetical protein DSUL_20350 [Desulfovibrionales bacterium]
MAALDILPTTTEILSTANLQGTLLVSYLTVLIDQTHVLDWIHIQQHGKYISYSHKIIQNFRYLCPVPNAADVKHNLYCQQLIARTMALDSQQPLLRRLLRQSGLLHIRQASQNPFLDPY